MALAGQCWEAWLVVRRAMPRRFLMRSPRPPLCCRQSFLIIDGVKVLMLTLTSPFLVDRLLTPGSLARVILRTPMRRLHVALDFVTM